MRQDELNNACRMLFLTERSSAVVQAVGALIAGMVRSGRIESAATAVHWIERIACDELTYKEPQRS